LIGIIVIVVLIGTIFVASDWENFSQVLREANWRLILPALFFTVLSYSCVGISYAMVSKLLRIKMGWRDLSEIGFVTVILNHVVTTGGVAGLSVRYLLMERHGVKMREMLSSSLMHFYLTSIVMIAALPFSFYYLLNNAALPKGVAIFIGIVSVIVIAGSIIGALLLFVNALRSPVLGFVGKIVNKFTRQDIHDRFERFNTSLNMGSTKLGTQPLKTLTIILIIVIEWAAAVVALGFCFDALGPVPSPGVLITGFVIGFIAGALSMVPGGFGVQEASMAGIFALLGVRFEQALLTAILFRGVYYLIPYGFSLFFYWRLLREGRNFRGKEHRREDSITA
jgi:uncharacterized protein (TIRG00374 family)